MTPNLKTHEVAPNVRDLLHQLIARGETLEITTCFRGMSLTSKTNSLLIDDDCLHFKSMHDISSIKLGQAFHISHELLPTPIIAITTGIDQAGWVVTLSECHPADHSWMDRKHERVQPKNPMRAMITSSNNTMSTCVVDLSERGAGLLLYHMKEKGFITRPSSLVQVGIRLPNITSPLLVHGTISRIRQIGKSAMASIGVVLLPNEKQSRQLKNYINLRQAEILEEMAHSFRYIVEPAQTKDLYF